MEIKKSKEADLERERTDYVLIGLLIAFSVVYIAFEWAQIDTKPIATVSDIIEQHDGEEEVAPITEQPDLPPPPPAPAPVLDPVIEDFNVTEKAETKAIDLKSEDTGEAVEAPAPAVSNVVEQEEEEKPDDVIYTHVDQKAEFPGGVQALYKYLGDNIHYPDAARENGIQGTVMLQFTVNADGSIQDIVVKRSPDISLEKEAVRVVKSMPKWKPGENNHKKVRSKFSLPVAFKLG